MKTPLMNPAIEKLLDSLDPEVDLWKCHQCGQCSAICPSYRHGGIKTREIMELVLVGGIDPKENDSIWLCAMCNGCSERCQLGVDPTGVIVALRNLAAESGNIPEHFKQEARLLNETGISFPITGLTKKLRKELGLDPLEVSEAARTELKCIVEKTGLGGIDLE